MVRQVTPTAGAQISAAIVADDSGEPVFFGEGGQPIEIVEDPAQADIFICVSRERAGGETLSLLDAQAAATALQAPSKTRTLDGRPAGKGIQRSSDRGRN
jgi:hypothetical protein